jgi:membrane protein
LLDTFRTWPWLDTLATLQQRFREDRLGLTASSLTFTTLIALVPLATVAFAVFSAFPMFKEVQDALEAYFLKSLVPTHIAQPVLAALTQFASQAARLGSVGLIVLVATALALMLTIDRTLNSIWRVRRPRPIAQRVLVYWAAMTLGPVVIGVSLSVTSYAVSSSQGLVETLPGFWSWLLGVVEFMLLAAAMAGLYHYVPNTHVRWRHAWAGGLFVAVGIELAKVLLGWYLRLVPSYSAVYGPLATLPIFLIWMYAVWVVVLFGAVVAAYAPSLSMRLMRRPNIAGYRFELALALLRQLVAARSGPNHGQSPVELARALRADPLQVEALLDLMMELDWVARLEEDGVQRDVLICEPDKTAAAPLIDRLLLDPSSSSVALRQRMQLDQLSLTELLA